VCVYVCVHLLHGIFDKLISLTFLLMGKLEQNTINCSEQMCLLFHIHHSAIHSPGRGRKPKLKIVCLDLTHHNRGLLDVF